jgi:DNA polymerase III sliding clamp (beta) subunit (PCNA family)
MQARSSGVGGGEIVIEGKQEGDSNEIAFNVKFLNDFLKNTSGKDVSMQISSPVEPALFRVEDDPEFLHIIMPVRVQE